MLVYQDQHLLNQPEEPGIVATSLTVSPHISLTQSLPLISWPIRNIFPVAGSLVTLLSPAIGDRNDVAALGFE